MLAVMIVKAHRFDALMGGLVIQGEGNLTLVPEEDKRVAFESADVAFSDMLNDEKENKT